MKRRRRTLSIFTLSALDLFAVALGSFVLLVVVLLPYYRMNRDAHAEMEGVQEALKSTQSEIEAAQDAAAAAAAAGRDLGAAAATALEAATAALEQTRRDTEAAAAAGEQARALQAKAERIAARLEALQAETAKARRMAAERKKAGQAPTPPPPMPAVAPSRGIFRPLMPALDLVIVIDTTGSMGEALEDLSESMGGIVAVLQKLVVSLRVGVVAYRDYDVNSWLTRDLPLTAVEGEGLRKVQRFVSALEPAGRFLGGNTAREAMLSGLKVAWKMAFRGDARQVIIVIGDAAPHRYEEGETLARTEAFVRSGRRAAPHTLSALLVPTRSLTYYGDQDDRRFLRKLAKTGGGTFSEHTGEMLESILFSVLEE